MARARARSWLLMLGRWLGIFGLGCGLAGCDPTRELVLAPILPTPCVTTPVNELRVRGLGDFPPAQADTASLASGALSLDLPRGTRVVSLEGVGAGGATAFGRTAPFELPALWDGAPRRVPIAYGPPDTMCETATLAYPRAGHRATLLTDGSVLLSGGVGGASAADGSGPVVVLERYLPTGDATHPVAAFVPVAVAGGFAIIDTAAVLGHEAIALDDGRVLLSGGVAAEGGLAAGVAYQGAQLLASDGTPDGPPRVLPGGGRAEHAATRLPDGRVLLTGGCSELAAGVCLPGHFLDGAILYDPAIDAFGAAVALVQPRAGHRALLRDDGLVVLIGGTGEGGVALGPELYDPGEARGSTIAGPAGTAAAITSGLIIALNDAAGPTGRAVAWSGRDEAPLLLPQLEHARAGATITALEDGAALVAGGADSGALVPESVVLFPGEPARPVLGFAAYAHTATRLRDGTVLVAGGFGGDGRASARAAVFLRSAVGPFESPATIAFDGSRALTPSRPDRVAIVDGALTVDGGGAAARVPEAFALLSGPDLAGPGGAGFTLSLLVGRAGDAEVAILFGDPASARYVVVGLASGAAARAVAVRRDRPGLVAVDPLAGCDAAVVADDEVPDGALAAMTLRARGGRLELTSARRTLLSCPADPDQVPARGAVALGAFRGRGVFDNVQVER